MLKLDPSKYKNVWGVLAAPPCTHFTNASSRLWKTYDADGRFDLSLSLVTKTFDLVEAWKDTVRLFALENPPGRLRRFIGAPGAYFHPFEYAGYLNDDIRFSENYWTSNRYAKKTCLWGNFEMPTKRPMDRQDTRVPGQTAISLLPPGPDRANIRAKTPEGFALAFYLANRNR